MHAYTPLVALAALGLVNAIQVTSPSQSTVWSSGDNSQTIEWEAVNTDATSFAVLLVNQQGYLTDSPVTLISNQSTGSSDITNSATVTYSSGSWPTGVAFQINLVKSTSDTSSIYAQSQQFNITSSGSSSSSSSSSSSTSASSTSTGTAPTTLSSTSKSTSSVVTVTSTDASSTSSSSGDIPNTSSTTTAASSASLNGAPSTLVGLLIGAAGLLGVYL